MNYHVVVDADVDDQVVATVESVAFPPVNHPVIVVAAADVMVGC